MEKKILFNHIPGLEPGAPLAKPGLFHARPLPGAPFAGNALPCPSAYTLLRLTHPSSRLALHFAQLAAISSDSRAIFPGG